MHASTSINILLHDLPLNVIASGNSNAVDGVMMGTNHDEGTIFVARLAKVVPGVHTPMVPSDLTLIMNHFWGHNATVNRMISSLYDINNYPNATVQTEVMLLQKQRI
jgi:carboxylesterase type B